MTEKVWSNIFETVDPENLRLDTKMTYLSDAIMEIWQICVLVS